jgi:predicted DNA-binding transcriptional regulator YafY
MNKVERQINLVFLLLNTSKGLTRSQLKNCLQDYQQSASDSAFERMFERDKQDIKNMGFEIEVRQDDFSSSDEIFYSIKRSTSFFDLENFTLTERILLQVARLKLRALSSQPNKIVFKLENAQDSRYVAYEDNIEDTNNSLEVVLTAIVAKRKMKFAYLKYRTSSAEERIVTPLSLSVRAKFIYMITYAHDRGDYRVFRLDRIVGMPEIQEIDTRDYSTTKQRDFFNLLEIRSREIHVSVLCKSESSLPPPQYSGIHVLQDGDSADVFCSFDDEEELIQYLSENLQSIEQVLPAEIYMNLRSHLQREPSV